MMSASAQERLRATQLSFAAHLRDPQGVPRPEDVPENRAAVYRELFFANIRGALNSAFPVAREILSEAHWASLAQAFWREHRSHSPEFPRVPAEFLRWFDGRQEPEAWEPAFLADLLVWEHAELETLLAEDDDPVPVGDVWAGLPVLTRSLRVHAFQYPVQEISATFQPEEPSPQPVFLACFRNRDLNVDFMSVSPASAWLLEHMLAHPDLSGAEHTQALAEALGSELTAVETEARSLLEGFQERGVIVGVQAK